MILSISRDISQFKEMEVKLSSHDDPVIKDECILVDKKDSIFENSIKSEADKYGNTVTRNSQYEQFTRPTEIFAAVWYKDGIVMADNYRIDEDVKFCDEILGKVNSSYLAAAVRQLPKGLCLDVLSLYLAVKALNTIGDEVKYFEGKEREKNDYLNNFHCTALVTDGWKLDEVGKGDNRVLLEQYYRCVIIFKSLSIGSQEIITDIVKRMGQGMASCTNKNLEQGPVTVEDYNLHCHYYSGLVGEGVSRLFFCSGYENSSSDAVSTTLGNTFGIFLRKVDIIRDFLEDYDNGRTFWPQEIWKRHTVSIELGELFKLEARDRALACLDEMITDALELVPECIEYLNLMKTEEIFRFCAILQVTAMGTLAILQNNPRVLTGMVNIRQGMFNQLILNTKNTRGLNKSINLLAKEMLQKTKATKTKRVCEKIVYITTKGAKNSDNATIAQSINFISPSVIAITAYHLFVKDHKCIFSFPELNNSLDYLALNFLLGSLLFFLGYNFVGLAEEK